MQQPQLNPFTRKDAPGPARPSPPPERTPPAPSKPPVRILSAQDIMEDALNFYKFGHGSGETTHFSYLDPFWTWKKKELTIITGNPNHGKSWWVLQVMLVKAALKGWKFALFVPENFPASELFVSLAQMLVGCTAHPKAGHNRMTMEQFTAALEWLNGHFWLVDAEEGATPTELLNEFARIHAQVGLDGVLIDPWNQLTHNFQAREDLYLSEQLSILKRFAIKNDLAVLVTAHPAGQAKDKNGDLVRPDAYNISGGKMFNNKADNVLAIFRPNFPDPETELWIHKIKKQGLVGQPGMITLGYTRETFRYDCPTDGSVHPLSTVSFNKPGTIPSPTSFPVSTFDDEPRPFRQLTAEEENEPAPF